MPFHSVAVRCVHTGQDIVNVLWYRSIPVIGDLLELVGLQDALAAAVYDQVVKSQSPTYVGGRGLLDVISSAAELQDLTVASYNDSGTPLSTTPTIHVQGGAGQLPGETNGPAPCAIIAFQLGGAFGPGVGLPRRGHVKVGPMPDVYIDSSGHLTATARSQLLEAGQRMATNVVTVAPPGIFSPIRVRITRSPKVLDLPTFIIAIGYRDIDNSVVRPVARFLRSRLPEA